MDNNVKINQTAKGDGSTQIGVQNNYSGLSVTDATSMAFAMFREYYPQLRAEALSDIESMVEKKLSAIPPEAITSPSPRTTVPALQYASITEEQDIRELYANLLVKSMDSFSKNNVHPGFIEIIKQLSPDEAKVMRYFSRHSTVPMINLRFESNDHASYDIVSGFSNVGELSGCEYPLNISLYFDNLSRLGLVEKYNDVFINNKAVYEPLKNHPYIKVQEKNNIGNFKYKDYQIINHKEGLVKITAFGKTFCSICL